MLPVMALVLAALSFTVCGGGIGGSSPRAVTEQFWAGIQEQDEAAVRATASKPSLDKADFSQQQEGDSGIEKVEIGKSTITDATAAVETTIHGGEGEPVTFDTQLVQEDGAWKVDMEQTMGMFMPQAMQAAMNAQGQAPAE